MAGIDVLSRPDHVRGVIGCVAQKSGVDVNATGRENLTLQGRFHGLGGTELKSREDAITVLLTTHYLEEADRLAHRLAIVDRGRIVAEGTPEALKAELSGDAVQIDLEDTSDESRIRTALAGVGAAREVTVEGLLVRARADDGASAVPAMITALEPASARVRSVRVTSPSLDDVYLRYTGRSFSEADSGGAR